MLVLHIKSLGCFITRNNPKMNQQNNPEVILYFFTMKAAVYQEILNIRSLVY